MRLHNLDFLLAPDPTAARPLEDLAALLVPAQPWMRDALCAQTGGEMHFPENGENPTAARAVCARCDVSADCLEYALAIGPKFGIWAGLSVLQLKAERRRRSTHKPPAASGSSTRPGAAEAPHVA